MSEFTVKEDDKDKQIKKLLIDIYEADQIIKNLDLKSIKQKEKIRELEELNKKQNKKIDDNTKIVEDFNNKFNNVYTKYCKYKKESIKLKEKNKIKRKK